MFELIWLSVDEMMESLTAGVHVYIHDDAYGGESNVIHGWATFRPAKSMYPHFLVVAGRTGDRSSSFLGTQGCNNGVPVLSQPVRGVHGFGEPRRG